MQVIDFERAIEALNCNVQIDHVKIRPGKGVRQVIGHTPSLILIWDDTGRAWSGQKDQPLIEIFESGTDETKKGTEISRDKTFDLKFD